MCESSQDGSIYLFPLIGNMDKTPVFFDMIPERSLVQTAKKSVTIRTSSSKNRHLTFVFTVVPDIFILRQMIIFRGKTNLTIEDIVVREGFVVIIQEKALMDESLMFTWFEKAWQTYTKEK